MRGKKDHCLDPNACAKEAKKIIDLIPPKLNPTYQGHQHGNLSLTKIRKKHNITTRATNDTILFDPTIIAQPYRRSGRL